MTQHALILVLSVIAVGVLHTLVPDHWAPIALMARQFHWSRAKIARTAFGAGLGHTVSTLAIGLIVWFAGLAVAQRYGHLVSLASSIALIGFGGWIALSSLREVRADDLAHERGESNHESHHHAEKPSARMALLLILGSSPMVEGIPLFFAASKFGGMLIVLMSVLFAISTIATYVVLCVYSGAALRRISFGPLERFGEVISGSFITLVGIIFLIWPIA